MLNVVFAFRVVAFVVSFLIVCFEASNLATRLSMGLVSAVLFAIACCALSGLSISSKTWRFDVELNYTVWLDSLREWRETIGDARGALWNLAFGRRAEQLP